MGNFLSSYVGSTLDYLSSYWATPCRIIILGLDGAGKTTLLNKIKLGKVVTTEPTIGFNVEMFRYKNIEFTAWDMGGQTRVRRIWIYYVNSSDAVIFVVDSADRSRIIEAADELRRIFHHKELRDAKLLVYANKQDQPDCMTTEEIREKLDLDSVTRNPSRIQPMVAVSGDGVYEGIDWLSKALTGAV